MGKGLAGIATELASIGVLAQDAQGSQSQQVTASHGKSHVIFLMTKEQGTSWRGQEAGKQ
jgi:hypothetical protein